MSLRRYVLIAAASVSAMCALALLPGSPIDIPRAHAAERRVVLVPDADYFGDDYKTVKDVDIEGCKATCLEDNQCQAFTYNTSARWCFLKRDFGDLKSFAGAIAGRVVDVRPAPSPKATVTRRAEMDFLPTSLRGEADRFASSLASRYDPASQGFSALVANAERAKAAGKAENAANLFARALTLAPERYDLWISLANAAIDADPDDWQATQRMRKTASSSAINAYLRAVDEGERVRSLVAIGKALESRNIWLSAIRSYRAALKIRNDPQVRGDYERVVAQHGFRITGHNVESDAAEPRICVVFSSRLQTVRPNLADFMTVSGAPGTSVNVEDSQMCVVGVRHGARYQISVRAGVPAANGETLEKPVELTVYVRDRAPAVHFVGRAYVLPRGDDPTIPVVTVNTDKLKSEIYRIDDRALAALIRDNKFLDQLSSRRTQQLTDDQGEKIWEGTLDVSSRLNADVTTAIPLDDIGLEMKPGAYVMVARVESLRADQWGPLATQWFIVSDLGLTSYTGRDGLHVFVRSLTSAKAVADVPLTLVAANNEILGKATTDAMGYAHFAPGLVRGTGGLRPAVLNAGSQGADYAFLDLTKTPFDLSDRGVEGRHAPGPLDVYAYTERGVYRPGADVHAVALVRDEKARAAAGVPLTIIFQRPDGVEQRRFVVADGGQGGHAVDLHLPASAMRGTWTMLVHADPKASALAEIHFLVEDFQPERVAFELTPSADRLDPSVPANFTVDADYLYGAPAGGMKLEGKVTLRPTREWKAFKGYRFGLADEAAYPNSQALPNGLATDAQGKLSFAASLPDSPVDTQLATAEVVARLVDAGGRYIERSATLPVVPDGARIGIKPAFTNAVEEGGPADFDVIYVGSNGERQAAKDLAWTLSKLETHYQWFFADGSWQYDVVKTTHRVSSGNVDIAVERPAHLSLPVEWGAYRLEITSAGKEPTASSVEFSAGWYVAKANAETPDALEVGLDKDKYRSGEIAQVRLKPRFPGIALIAVMADGLIDTKVVEITKAGDKTVDLPVTDAWGAGAYVTATLYRPMDIAAKRMPARAIGLQWIGVEPGDRDLQIALDAPQTMRPNTTLAVPLTLANLKAGEEAYVTVAAVDVGILNLTRYEAPAPDRWYFGQRELGVEMRDLYGQLIDRTLGTRGRIRSGGDGAGMGVQGPPPTQNPLALFSGIVQVDDKGKATASFDIPDFNGTVRLMAVAWSAAGVGHATQDVVVRDSVVATVSLPHFVAPGDASRLLVELDNVEGPAGTYALSFTQTNEIEIDAGDTDLSVDLAEHEHKAVRVPIKGKAVGDAELTLVVNGPQGPVTTQTVALGVRDLQPEISHTVMLALSPGKDMVLDDALFAGLKTGRSRLSFTAGSLAGLDVAGLLSSLNRYPYGCSEQLVSVAMPLLYLNRVAAAVDLGGDDALHDRVRKALVGILAKQSANGAFGLWGPGRGDSDLWLDAYVTDFLTRAKEAGYDVPSLSYTLALDNLANSLAYASDFESGGEDVAYTLYVLTRAGRASIGDVRYYIDARLDRFSTPFAKAQLGAAAALYGETQRATMAFKAALASYDKEVDTLWQFRSDYGSHLRDVAGLLALAAESKVPGLDMDGLKRRLTSAAAGRRYTSTQDKAWMLLAANALLARDPATPLVIDGATDSVPATRLFDGAKLQNASVKLSNPGADTLDVAVTVSGPPSAPLKAAANGYTLTRETYDLDGKLVDAAAVAQNTRVVVVLRVQALDDRDGRIMLVDPLPGGFEIDNPKLVRSGDLGALDWLALDTESTHTEFRDDRFVVTFNRKGAETRNSTFAYLARAVTPGSYVRPPAQVVDMYRPERFARTASEHVEVVGPNR